MKRHIWKILYGVVLFAFTAYVLLDTFVIARVYQTVETHSESASESAAVQESASGGGGTENTEGSSGEDVTDAGGSQDTDSETENAADSESDENSGTEAGGGSGADEENAVTVTDNSYNDGNISITIDTYREYDTDIYVADITLSSAQYLKTALAKNAYGRNLTECTSTIAAGSNAILAVNGDYYGSRESGYVIRNGVLYRSSAKKGQEDLVIYSDGSFGIINEEDITAQELLENGAQQVFSFGPALIEGGAVSVSESDEVGKAKASNPRTAIGIIDSLHYVLVVSDGRTDESEGLSLFELAEFMEGLGVSAAYNLDGGGSSTMVFNGAVINNPTTDGYTVEERGVSDIVYIG